MRRATLLLVIGALLLAGCGSSSSSSGGPQNTELSYFPAGAPFVALAQTDPNGQAVQNLNSFIGQFPFGKLATAAIESEIARAGLNFQSDIKPLLGNPVALGAAEASEFNGSSFLVVFIAKDAGKLAKLLTSHAQSVGSYDGAKLYQDSNSTLALDGATAILARSTAQVKAALQRHAHGAGLSESAFTGALKGLPQGAILQVYGSLGGLLSTPKAARARAVPWVASLRSYGVAMAINSSGVSLSYRINTSGGALSANQLPLPSGSTAPTVSGQAPVAFGLRDLSHVISFALGADQAAAPASYAKFLKNEALVRTKTGVDLNKDVFSQLSGNLEVDYGATGVIGRAQLNNPSAARRALASAGQLFSHPKSVASLGGGFYSVRSGRKTVDFGIVGNELVAGTASVSQLRTFAASPAAPVTGAQGPAAFQVSVGEVITLALAAAHRSGALPPEASSILNMFGNISGWAANDPSGLHGSVSIPLK